MVVRVVVAYRKDCVKIFFNWDNISTAVHEWGHGYRKTDMFSDYSTAAHPVQCMSIIYTKINMSLLTYKAMNSNYIQKK